MNEININLSSFEVRVYYLSLINLLDLKQAKKELGYALAINLKRLENTHGVVQKQIDSFNSKPDEEKQHEIEELGKILRNHKSDYKLIALNLDWFPENMDANLLTNIITIVTV